MSKIIHHYQYPERFTKDGRKVTNEMCSCGALKTEHAARYSPGHGKCERTHCAQFTWSGYVFSDGKTLPSNLTPNNTGSLDE